jgi:hypothetical protein
MKQFLFLFVSAFIAIVAVGLRTGDYWVGVSAWLLGLATHIGWRYIESRKWPEWEE